MTVVTVGPEDADRPVRALVLHHAGGSALSMASLARAAPPQCAVRLAELGGRPGRPAGTAPVDYAAAVAQLRPLLLATADRPTVLFGHSLGGLLAHSLLCTAPEEVRRRVVAVVVSAAPAPPAATLAANHPQRPFLVRSRADVDADLARFGGTAPAVLADPGLRAEAVETLGRDTHLLDTYLPPRPAEVGAAYHLWHGRDDPTFGPDDVRQWRAYLGEPISVRTFDGGHFYLAEDPAVLAAWRELLVRCATGAHARSPEDG